MPTCGPGAETSTEETRGRRLVITPRPATVGPVEPGLRKSERRTCQETSPPVPRTFHVSTSTAARSSDWGDSVVRRTNFSPDVHRPSRSQDDVTPLLLRPRTSTSSQLSPGVVAAHDAISSV